MSAPGDTTPLEADFAALRKLRDASGALREFFGDGEDPRLWTAGRYADRSVTVEDGRVTKLNLSYCTSLTALPDAIGELKALTTLNLYECSSIVTLPAAIGELDALRELNVSGCSSLLKLPDVIAGREGLSVVGPIHMVSGPVAEDFTALRKLRDDDASGALKEFFRDGEDPSKWQYVTVEDYWRRRGQHDAARLARQKRRPERGVSERAG